MYDVQRVSASSRKRNLIMKLYVDTGLAKIEGAGEYVGDLLECGAKFLVFAHHQQVLAGIDGALASRVPLQHLLHACLCSTCFTRASAALASRVPLCLHTTSRCSLA